jgi:hypothetical protein
MPHTQWIWEIVNWSSLPILAVLTAILVRRGLRREFPWFFWFIVVTNVATALRFFAQFASRETYFYLYWITELLTTVVNFLAAYELFVHRLFPNSMKVRFYRYLFPAIAAIIIFMAWLTALVSPNRSAAFLIETRVLAFILVSILIFFVLLMMVMGRVWTRYDFGIALGFGINSAGFLAASAAWVRSHYKPTSVDHLPVIAYDLACLIWLFCFWTGKQVDVPAKESALSIQALQEARKWEDSLKDLLTPGKR